MENEELNLHIIPDENFIRDNYDKTTTLIEKFFVDEERKQKVLKLFEMHGERYAVCPASATATVYSAFPGGLCFHNLNVAKWINRFAATMFSSTQFTKESLLLVSLLAEFGKIGDENEEYFIPYTDDWHLKNGMHYKFNEKIEFMRVPHRSLYLAQSFNILLTSQEYLAIMLSDGQYDESNAPYKWKEVDLSILLNFANLWSQKQEKKNTVCWPNR